MNEVETSAFVEKVVLDRQNQESKFYYKFAKTLTYSIPIVYTFLIIYHYYGLPFANEFNYPEFCLNVGNHLMDISGMLILLAVFNFKRSRKYILAVMTRSIYVAKSLKHTSVHDTSLIGVRFLGTVIAFSLFFFAPMYIRAHFWQVNYRDNMEAYGLNINAFCFFIMLQFLCILMPDLLLKKLGKDEANYQYRFIYWIYFMKSRLLESPIIFLFVLPLLVMALSVITYLYMCQVFSEIDKIIYALLGLTLTLSITVAAEFMKSYTKLISVFNDYSNHLIKNRLILCDHFKIVQIGYGNFGSTIIRTLMNDYLTFIKRTIETVPYRRFFKKKFQHSKFFEIIIDRDFELKLLSREHIIIDTNQNKFEETFSDSSFNFKFGFFNCPGPNPVDIKSAKYKTFGIPGIKANGSNFALWKILNLKEKPIVINTTSDHNLPILMKKYIDEGTFKQLEDARLISTVSNENIEAHLLTTGRKNNFPINYTFYEASGIINRLSLLLSKLGTDKLMNINLFFCCPMETMNDLVNMIRANLILLHTKNIEIFITSNIYVINSSIELNSTVAYNHFPNLMNATAKRIKIDSSGNIIYQPTKKSFYDNLLHFSQINDITNIFIAYSADSVITLKLLSEIRSMTFSLKIKNKYLLTSISENYQEEVSQIVNSFHAGNNRRHLFPKYSQHYIMLKDLTISNQISAIVLSQTNKKSLINRTIEEEYFCKGLHELYQLELCTVNKPFAFIQILSILNNSKLLMKFQNGEIFPFYKNNFSYPVSAEKDLFVFRADFSLMQYSGCSSYSRNLTQGIIINPNNEDLKIKFLPSLENSQNNTCINCALMSTSMEQSLLTEPLNYCTGLGYLKIKSKNNNITGSLLNVLLLLYYGKVEVQGNLNSKHRYDIVYETGSMCPTTRSYLHKYYIMPASQTYDVLENIISLEMHYSNLKDKLWLEYVEIIKKYFFSRGEIAHFGYGPTSLIIEFKQNPV